MTTVIFKATDLCNSNCIYCHAIHTDHQNIKVMPYEILEKSFIRANEFLTEKPEERLNIVWHGGEPLTLGPDYFYKALEFKEKHCKDTSKRISFEIQSNLTLFSPEYLDVLKKLEIQSIGTSYEIIPAVRGWGGKEGSDKYNKQFLRAVSLLEHEGFSWGIIYVVTRLALKNPSEIFRALTNLVPSASVMFNPVTYYKSRPEQFAITPEEFVDFLGAIFPEWWHDRNRLSGIDPFNALVDNIITGNTNNLICVDSGKCADTHISISPDGMVWQCGRSSDWGLMDYGSIMEHSLSDIMNHPQKDLLRKRSSILKDGECKDCRFWDICHGGCPLDSLGETGSVMHKSPWCWTKKGFIENHFEPITGIKFDPSHKPATEAEATCRESISAAPYIDLSSSVLLKDAQKKNDLAWIGPVNSIEDVLMVSGILKQIHDNDSSKKFNIITRTSYKELLQGHPAVAEISQPPLGTEPVNIDHIHNKEVCLSNKSAYQMLADIIGLKTPAEESLFVSWKFEDDLLLKNAIPWKKYNILICPFSESPRMELNIPKWEALTNKLLEDNSGVMQIINRRRGHIRGAYSIMGLANLKELISFVRNFDMIITSHSIFMHIAKLHNIPAIVLWGPIDHDFYGYKDQHHLQNTRICKNINGCIGNERADQHFSACPLKNNHCMNLFDVDAIYELAHKIAF